MAITLAATALLPTLAASSASASEDTGGGSAGGFGWSFLIPAAVIGLVMLGALLATRVGRAAGPDSAPDAAEPAEPAGGDVERTREDPTV
ncbi:hypothetical protein [Nocardioides kribbensis]|uniref:MFS transporter n=1 Tax=Nocardioides kribbensis TaxID=305517 RepID=A0ABV1NT76_9ACTN